MYEDVKERISIKDVKFDIGDIVEYECYYSNHYYHHNIGDKCIGRIIKITIDPLAPINRILYTIYVENEPFSIRLSQQELIDIINDSKHEIPKLIYKIKENIIK